MYDYYIDFIIVLMNLHMLLLFVLMAFCFEY
jgi:hypothetical protein